MGDVFTYSFLRVHFGLPGGAGLLNCFPVRNKEKTQNENGFSHDSLL
jgi:hypothetical protein